MKTTDSDQAVPWSLTERDRLRWQTSINHSTRMDLLRQRHRLLLEARKWFDHQGFIETETPLLVRSPSPEAHFFLFEVLEEQHPSSEKSLEPSYLITSPEFQMKRLLVGGFERIFQICRCFRGQERGDLHHPEFTMLEWYRAQVDLERVMEDTEELCCSLSGTSGAQRVFPAGPWPRLKVRELFQERLGIELNGTETVEELMEKVRETGREAWISDLLQPEADDALTYESIFFRLWNRIEPELGIEVPVWITEWPLPLASLARPLPERPGFAERAECYVNGMELANGFGELTDPVEQRRRFEEDLRMRQSQQRPEVPMDLRFLESLEEGMPPSSGMALGLDRLVLWITGAERLDEVVCFSWPER